MLVKMVKNIRQARNMIKSTDAYDWDFSKIQISTSVVTTADELDNGIGTPTTMSCTCTGPISPRGNGHDFTGTG
jgi:hypothetical protein